MRNNFDVNWDTIGQYATDLFTDKAVEMIDKHDQKKPMFLYVSHLAPHAGNEYDPLQVREEDLLKFNYIEDPNRRKYAAMVSRLDDSVGRIVQALERNNMLDDSIVLFMADNGAPVVGQHSNAGSNFPFKGVSCKCSRATHQEAKLCSPFTAKGQPMGRCGQSSSRYMESMATQKATQLRRIIPHIWLAANIQQIGRSSESQTK